jgi:leucyl aminopeptidase
MIALHPLLAAATDAAIPVHVCSSGGWPALKVRLTASQRHFADAQAFEPGPGKQIILPLEDGSIGCVIVGVTEKGKRRADPFEAGRIAPSLPAGTYRLEGEIADATLATLGWLLSAYRFDRYRKPKPVEARIALPDGVDGADLTRIVEGVTLARDLVNTPANDLGPAEIETAMRDLAKAHGATISSIVGDDLLAANFPMIHAVGRASPRPPRLIDMQWGDQSHPKITLVGKGVAFDTGGLNLKPDASMLLMKKDMGGAAASLAAAHMIMAAKLPVRLRVLVAAVENSVSGNAFRPGDVLASRKGLSVEIGNTDAEGRLILGDALALADEESPALLVDYATLTGAARVALGPDLPPAYTHDEKLAADMARLSMAINDPVWFMPLWGPYDRMLDSKIADLNHISGGAFAGSITAALFLNRFVTQTGSYAHFDIYGWNPATKPGRPEGGETQAARLTFALVKERFG